MNAKERDWDGFFMREAANWAEQSTCVRRHVGAVAVLDRRILGAGYNGNLPGAQHCDEGGCPRCNDTEWVSGAGLERCVCVHAEQNLIAWCARRGTPLEGADIYTTTYPCSDCMKLLISAGIKTVFFHEGYAEQGAALDPSDFIVTARIE